MKSILRKCAAVTCLFFLALPFSQIHADISITPSLKRIDLGNGKKRIKGQFEIVNTGGKTERYRIGATHFIWLEDGNFAVVEPDETSLASWIKFSPKEFDMPPNSRRVVRYVIQPRGKPADGYYWTAMELENLELQRREVKQGDATYSIGMGQSILVPVYAKLGKVDYVGEVENVELDAAPDGKTLNLEIQNNGSAILFLSGRASVKDASGKTLFESRLDGGPLLPWKKRYYKTFLKPDISPGEYTLHVVYNAAGLKKPLEKELVFNWAG